MSRKPKRQRRDPSQGHLYAGQSPREEAPRPVAPTPTHGGSAPAVTGARTVVAAAAGPAPTVRTRDQERARFAYQRVGAVVKENWAREYRTQLYSLGANILRSGLSVAVGFVQRSARTKNQNQSEAAECLLEHLIGAGLPGLSGHKNGDAFGDAVRGLDLDGYMLASREALAVVTWLERAAQVLIKDPADAMERDDSQAGDGDA